MRRLAARNIAYLQRKLSGPNYSEVKTVSFPDFFICQMVAIKNIYDLADAISVDSATRQNYEGIS